MHDFFFGGGGGEEGLIVCYCLKFPSFSIISCPRLEERTTFLVQVL